jgi:putative sigma-54 modulation protein
LQITVRGRNVEVSASLRDYVEKKVGKLERQFDTALAAQVMMNVTRDRHTVEVTIPLNGMVLRCEETTGDMYSAVDLVADKLERQVAKYKTRLTRRGKSAEERSADNRLPTPQPVPAEDQEPHIVRTKRFALKPMTIDEAVLQLGLIGHDFFIFTNAQTDRINVLYRRHDGNYGLIEPE